jgi:membrane-associated phospholipid phosphatase
MTDSSKFAWQAGWGMLACLLAVVSAASAQDAHDAIEAAPYSNQTEPRATDSAMALGKNIIRDQRQIWTSPFRMKRRDVKWWLIFGAATGALIATDHRSAQQLPSTGDQVAFGRRVSNLGAAYTLVPIAGGFYLSGILVRQSKLRDTGLLGAEALVDSLIVSEVFKVAAGRQRPLEGDGGGHFFHGSDGFPSGHTIETFALASVIAHQYHDNKAVVVLAYGLATMVGASRFSARQHFASDIVAGGVMGWFIGRHVTERNRGGTRSTARGWLAPEVVPQIRPSDHSYGLLLAWHP